MRRRIRFAARLARKLATDRRAPRWLRALIVVGLAPIPGPVDEIALGLAALVLATRHRRLLAELAREPEAGAPEPMHAVSDTPSHRFEVEHRVSSAPSHRFGVTDSESPVQVFT